MTTLSGILTATPISERAAAYLESDLVLHRNRPKTGRCRPCGVPDCPVARSALFELVMAGRRPETALGWGSPR